jgi:hypothetical protein
VCPSPAIRRRFPPPARGIFTQPVRFKIMKNFLRFLLVLAGLTAALNAFAADAKSECCKEKSACCSPEKACCQPAATTAKADAYPLATCVVSGDKLGDMGEPYVHVHKQDGKPDRTVKFCCKGCLKDFQKDPAKYLKLLDEASAPKAKA